METKTLKLHPLLPSTSSECLRCVERLKNGLLELKGVESVEIDSSQALLTLKIDPLLFPLDKIEERAKMVGLEVAERFSHRTMDLIGLDCSGCAEKIEQVLSKLEGIVWVSVNITSGKMEVEFDNSRIDLKEIVEKLESLGYGVAEKTRATVFHIYGMDCEKEASLVEKAISSLKGVEEYRIDLAGSRLILKHHPSLSIQEVLRAIQGTGLEVSVEGEEIKEHTFKGRFRATVISGLSLLMGLIFTLLGAEKDYTIPFYLVSILSGGYPIAKRGLLAARHRTFDMNFLMTVAVIGAMLIDEWAEGATITFLFILSQSLESLSMEKARRAIKSLMDLSPPKALVLRDGNEEWVPVEEVRVGETMIVKPGERIALDGRIIKGSSTIDQSPVTGESIPVWKGPGEEVFAGTINREGSILVEVTHSSKDSTLARIIHMVEEAQARKAPIQSMVDRFAGYYTPAVIITAIIIVSIPPLLFDQPFREWFYRGLVLLVMACPCALVLSTPVSIVSGLASAARKGILIKGGVFLEGMGKLKTMVFDKTGTLTEGRLEVVDVVPIKGDKKEVLRIGASIEARSEHPIASAIIREVERMGIVPHGVEGFQAFPGKGAKAKLDGKTYFVGNHRLFEEMGFCTPQVEERLQALEKRGETVVMVGDEEGVIGFITLSDVMRKEARRAIEGLLAMGIEKVIMLTGDNRVTAGVVARKLGITEYRAELMPQDKALVVRELAQQGPTAMVGDGVNDAPALAQATAGIAMGAAGTDIAIETADIALMSDDLSKLPYLLTLSRETLRTIRANIAFSIFIKFLFLFLATFGLATLWMAVIADTGASLLVIFNGLRLLRK